MRFVQNDLLDGLYSLTVHSYAPQQPYVCLDVFWPDGVCMDTVFMGAFHAQPAAPHILPEEREFWRWRATRVVEKYAGVKRPEVKYLSVAALTTPVGPAGTP